MSKLIEFCGAPGVGKSTVYRAVSDQWKEGYDWMPAHKVYPRKQLSHPVKKLLSMVLNEEKPLDEQAMRKAGSRFISLYPAYVDDCWGHLVKREKKSLNNTDQRFEKATHIFKTIQKVQICKETLAAKTVLIEEGLINGIGNALHHGDDRNAVEEEIQALYSKLPMPDGLIFLAAEPEVILQRLGGRKRFVPSLENLEKDDLLNTVKELSQLRETAVEIYKAKRFPVLRLNASDPVALNAERVVDFLRSFN